MASAISTAFDPGCVKTQSVLESLEVDFGGLAMTRFIEGEDRNQITLFPERLEDYVGEDNPVRVVDAFVDHLELGELGFSRVVPRRTGHPSYRCSDLLKLYVYGYLNRVQSSRRLEVEC